MKWRKYCSVVKGFLDQDGLSILFSTLERLSNERANASKGSIITSMELLHCVGYELAIANVAKHAVL